MSRAIHLQPCFILHTRAFSNSSLILEGFTRDYGRIGLLAKGIKRPKSMLRGIVQPFVPLLVSWVGRNDLVTLTHAEIQHMQKSPKGNQLLSGLYLNELTLRLLHRFDPHPDLFDHYAHTIETLGHSLDERVLRHYEKNLLEELGYGLSLRKDSQGNAIQGDGFYRFDHEQGFISIQGQSNSESVAWIFQGASLQAFAQDDLSHESALRDAKRLIRLALQPLLAGKPLNSRELFV